MALPYVKIKFANGALGTVAPSADKVVGILGDADAVAGKFQQGKAYQVYRLDTLSKTLGISKESDLYKAAAEFYAEAGTGAELWIYAPADEAEAPEMDFIKQAGGRLRAVAIVTPVESASELGALQGIAEEVTETLYAPVTFIAGSAATLAADLTETAYNRVMCVIGSTSAAGIPAVGVVAGRYAATEVQENVGKVRLGALSIDEVYIDGEAVVDNDKAESLNTKGYVTFRTYVGKAGWFITDDIQACETTDDYRSLARRRTIDKAFRIAYDTLLDWVNQEIPVTPEGTIQAQMVKSIEQCVESAVASNMGDALSQEGNELGVECVVDTEERIASTSNLKIALRVLPYGYAKYIDVELGFKIIS